MLCEEVHVKLRKMSQDVPSLSLYSCSLLLSSCVELSGRLAKIAAFVLPSPFYILIYAAFSAFSWMFGIIRISGLDLVLLAIGNAFRG